MNFTEIAQNRQSCRNFDNTKCVEQEKLDAILNAARLSPSACNGQPYHITVCTGDAAQKVARATQRLPTATVNDGQSLWKAIFVPAAI